jgi:hypothetical protein
MMATRLATMAAELEFAGGQSDTGYFDNSGVATDNDVAAVAAPRRCATAQSRPRTLPTGSVRLRDDGQRGPGGRDAAGCCGRGTAGGGSAAATRALEWGRCREFRVASGR